MKKVGRKIIPIALDLGGDGMPSGKNGIIVFYKELIKRCKRNKNRTTIHGTVITDKFISNIEFRLLELENKIL